MFLFDSKKIAKVIFNEIINLKEKEVNNFINNFLEFIKKNKIDNNKKQIIKYVDLEYKKYKTNQSLFIEAPFNFRSGDVDNIISKIKLEINNDTIINFKENKKIIGGFIIKYKNKIYNGSISNQLEKLKDSIKS